ncbi:MAG: 50S ribosomal protein P1 [Candidatus Pacearchaeota archaeon]
MQYIYAALLLHKAGKEINEENLKKVVEAAGIAIDEARIKTVVASLKGVDIDKVLQETTTMPISQGMPAAKAETKAEEKKPEKEEAAEGLAALFG